MLDDLFQADTLRVASDLVARPAPVSQAMPSFSLWKTATALPRGITAGVSQSGAFLSDVLGAFGQADATTYTGDILGNMPEQQRKETAQARQQLTTQGLDFSSEGGDLLRGVAQGYGPDPAAAHVAERLVFDFARFATKAVGYTVAGGSVVGPALTGFDEGMQAASDLKAAGVDINTRTAAGSVIGALSAVGVGLPMAGATALGTAGLVAAGGPLSFMGQQAAVRKILQDADYSKLAEQYDPFDPVGLAVATLVPAAFGVHGLRVNKAAAAAKAAEDFRTGPMPSKETPTAAAAREAARPSEDHVDAARTLLAVEERQRSNPGRADDPQAVQAHETALARAEEQLAAGERVSVADVAPTVERPVIQEKGAYLSAVLPDGQVGGTIKADGLHIHFAELAPESRGSGQGVAMYAALIDEAHARGLRVFSDSTVEMPAVRVYQALERRGYQVERLPGGELPPSPDAPAGALFGQGASKPVFEVKPRTDSSAPADLAQFQRTLTTNMRALAEQAAPAPRAAQGAKADAAAQTPRQATEATAKPQAADARSPAAATEAPVATEAAGSSAAAPRLVDDGAASRVAQIAVDHPDLMVQLDGMEKPMRLADVLAAVKAEADDMKLDGDLMQAAAECALLQGA